MKALVTGGSGFIGSHLVEALLQRGDEVRCLVRKTSALTWLKGLPVEFVYGHCNDRASLKKAVEGVDQVFHLAGLTKAVNEEMYMRVNASGTEDLIQVCLNCNPHLQRFVYLSSLAAAGPCRNGDWKKESDRCDPVSPYGKSKRRGEELALLHCHELPLVILRPSAVYGPREKDIYAYVKLISRKIKPCLLGQNQHLSLCYIQDVVQAILLASDLKDPKGDVFFVSDGQDYELEEIGDIFAHLMGVKAFRIPIPSWVMLGTATCSEVLSRFTGKPPLINRGKVEEMVQKQWVCDITHAKSVLGFNPLFRLEEGARRTVDWYRKENWL